MADPKNLKEEQWSLDMGIRIPISGRNEIANEDDNNGCKEGRSLMTCGQLENVTADSLWLVLDSWVLTGFDTMCLYVQISFFREAEQT
jgi:hypothetical protein